MIKILVDNYSNSVYEYGEMERGVFPSVDPNTELWKITNEKGIFYAVANGFHVEEVETLPTNYYECTYTAETGFVEIPREQTTEEKFGEVRSQIDYLAMMTDVDMPLWEE